MNSRSDGVPQHLRVAFHCGLWPMVVGLSCLATASVASSPVLRDIQSAAMTAGFLMLLPSVLINLVGMGNLAGFLYAHRKDAEILRRWKPRIIGIFLLLIANYPVALFCMGLGASMVLPPGD